ncbi:hypothetical protein ON010_g11266 [Phytophthora cinnamomi]|nr:hypothetical protein ON010_g11266 [Phytophthora cinnamomi]
MAPSWRRQRASVKRAATEKLTSSTVVPRSCGATFGQIPLDAALAPRETGFFTKILPTATSLLSAGLTPAPAAKHAELAQNVPKFCVSERRSAKQFAVASTVPRWASTATTTTPHETRPYAGVEPRVEAAGGDSVSASSAGTVVNLGGTTSRSVDRSIGSSEEATLALHIPQLPPRDQEGFRAKKRETTPRRAKSWALDAQDQPAASSSLLRLPHSESGAGPTGTLVLMERRGDAQRGAAGTGTGAGAGAGNTGTQDAAATSSRGLKHENSAGQAATAAWKSSAEAMASIFHSNDAAQGRQEAAGGVPHRGAQDPEAPLAQEEGAGPAALPARRRRLLRALFGGSVLRGRARRGGGGAAARSAAELQAVQHPAF